MIARKIKDAMEYQNMTQVELSQKSGISKSGISQYLSGKHEPKGKSLAAIAAALDVPEAWLTDTDTEVVTNKSEVDTEPVKNLSVARAARLMGKRDQFVRIGLQRGILPFGYAIKIGSRYSYHISPKKFSDYIGCSI